MNELRVDRVVEHYHSDGNAGKIRIYFDDTCCGMSNIHEPSSTNFGGGWDLSKWFKVNKPTAEMTPEEVERTVIEIVGVYNARRSMTKQQIEAENFKEALEEDPSGKECYHCGAFNNFADDCGFFYGTLSRKKDDDVSHYEDPYVGTGNVYRALCRECFYGLGFTTGER